MDRLSFDSYAKFVDHLNSVEGRTENSKIIVKEIYDALQSKKKVKAIKVFTVELAEEEIEFSVSVTREEWGTALASCLKHFEEQEMSDECIDTYMIIQELNELK